MICFIFTLHNFSQYTTLLNLELEIQEEKPKTFLLEYSKVFGDQTFFLDSNLKKINYIFLLFKNLLCKLKI